MSSLPRELAKKRKNGTNSNLDMKAIASGDFFQHDWYGQDAGGNSSTFDASGIESDVAKLETGDYSGPDEMGFTGAGIRWRNQTGAAFLIIPAGKESSSWGDRQWDGSD